MSMTARLSCSVRELPLVVPEPAVLTAFQGVVGPVFQRMKLLGKQAQTFATLRDTVLPRLISGQLRLPEAEAELEAAWKEEPTMALWLVRAGGRGEHELRFMEDDRIYLTWEGLTESNLSAIPDYDGIKQLLIQTYTGEPVRRIGNWCGQIGGRGYSLTLHCRRRQAKLNYSIRLAGEAAVFAAVTWELLRDDNSVLKSWRESYNVVLARTKSSSPEGLLSGAEFEGTADNSGSAAPIRRREQRTVDGPLASTSIERLLSGFGPANGMSAYVRSTS